MKLGLVVLPVALLVAFAALMVGCGGSSDTLTLDEYFAEFEAIDADVDAQIEDVYAGFPEDEAAFADDANLPFFKDLAAAFPRIVGDLLDRLNDLDPPGEVEDAHNELVAAGEDLLAIFEDTADKLDGTTTMAEFSALNDEADLVLAPVVTRFDNACLAVVDVAEANDIPIVITCQDE